MELEMQEYLALQNLADVYYEQLSKARKLGLKKHIENCKDKYHDVKFKMNKLRKKHNLTFASQ